MSPKAAILGFLIITIVSHTHAETVYDLLGTYGLPKGLLPEGVTEYTFDEESKTLTVTLPNLNSGQICSVTRKYEILGVVWVYNRVDLQPTISAKLEHKRLSNIEGITATVNGFFGVVNCNNVKITEFKVVGNKIKFISASPINTCKESPEFDIEESYNTPPKCDIHNSYSTLPRWLVDIVSENSQDDDIPLIYYKGARALLPRDNA